MYTFATDLKIAMTDLLNAIQSLTSASGCTRLPKRDM